jgi:hypothetical protein
MSFKKVLSHPNINMIVKKLSDGIGVRKVSKILQEMYPGDKKKHISPVTLQKFRKEHMKIEGDALEAIKEASKEQKLAKVKEQEHKEIKKLPSYKEKLQEAMDLHLDIRQQLANLHVLISARMEDLFDKLASGEARVDDEHSLQKYFQTYITLIERWAKYIDKVADYTVETNVNITVIEDQMALMRETVWEILQDMDPSLAVRFLERLDGKMKDMDYSTDKKPKFAEMHGNVKTLTANIEGEDDQ